MTYLCYCHIWQSLERVDHRIMEGPGRSTFFFVSRLLSHAIPCPLWNFACLLSSSRVISSFHNFSVLFSLTQICNLTFMALLWVTACCVFVCSSVTFLRYFHYPNSSSNVFNKQCCEVLKKTTQCSRNHEMSHLAYPVCLNTIITFKLVLKENTGTLCY